MSLTSLAAFEQQLKWVAFVLGVGSTVSVVFDWHLAAMLCSLPFCLIWIFCAWLHNEVQLKIINVVFSGFYIFGIARVFML